MHRTEEKHVWKSLQSTAGKSRKFRAYRKANLQTTYGTKRSSGRESRHTYQSKKHNSKYRTKLKVPTLGLFSCLLLYPPPTLGHPARISQIDIPKQRTNYRGCGSVGPPYPGCSAMTQLIRRSSSIDLGVQWPIAVRLVYLLFFLDINHC